MWVQLDQGWFPHDDGSFAQSAVRVLDGQLPHREFAELYSGGLTFLNAAVIHFFGEDLIVIRYPLYVLFLGLVPAAFYVARSFSGPLTALLASLVVATWSLPVYPSAVPSWYILVLSVYGAAALVRWRATGHSRWLFVCGFLAGISLTVKIVGVYFLLAVLLLLLFSHPRRAGRSLPKAIDIGSVCAVGLVGAIVISVLGSRHGRPEIVNLVIPIAAVTFAAVVERYRAPDVATGRRDSLWRDVVVVMAGVIIPLVVLALPYVIAGASSDLFEGVVVSPQSRRERSYIPTPEPELLLPALFLVAVIVVRSKLRSRPRRVIDLATAMAVAALLLAAAGDSVAYQAIWNTARGLAPVIAVVGGFLIVWRGHRSEPARDNAFLTVSLAAFMGLTQFPFGTPVYYCYVAPLVVLAAAGVVGTTRASQGPFVPSLLAAFALFGALYLDRTSLFGLGTEFVVDGQTEVLDEGRASIRVYPWDREKLQRVVALIHMHSDGRPIYAGPDLPHVYFLAREENQTRSLFDFLDTSDSARGDALVALLERSRVNVVAINHTLQFSEPLDPGTLRTLRSMYPREVLVGDIEVRWKQA